MNSKEAKQKEILTQIKPWKSAEHHYQNISSGQPQDKADHLQVSDN